MTIEVQRRQKEQYKKRERVNCEEEQKHQITIFEEEKRKSWRRNRTSANRNFKREKEENQDMEEEKLTKEILKRGGIRKEKTDEGRR